GFEIDGGGADVEDSGLLVFCANSSRQLNDGAQAEREKPSGSSPDSPHEPSEPPPGFGVCQSSGALAMEASQPKAPEDWRTPRRYRAIRRFMVPMHAEKTRKGLSMNLRLCRRSLTAANFLLAAIRRTCSDLT